MFVAAADGTPGALPKNYTRRGQTKTDDPTLFLALKHALEKISSRD
jgi:hypothetical protein